MQEGLNHVSYYTYTILWKACLHQKNKDTERALELKLKERQKSRWFSQTWEEREESVTIEEVCLWEEDTGDFCPSVGDKDDDSNKNNNMTINMAATGMPHM